MFVNFVHVLINGSTVKRPLEFQANPCVMGEGRPDTSNESIDLRLVISKTPGYEL